MQKGALDTLDSVLAGKKLGRIRGKTSDVDSDVPLDDATNLASAALRCPASVFRIVHLNPSRLKVLKTPFHNVRGDHVA